MGKPVKIYEVLQGLPPYGPMHVNITDGDHTFFSEGYVVRFYKADGTDWVANFATGWTDLYQTLELKESKYLLVIAGGACYIMDNERTKAIYSFSSGIKKTLITDSGRIILQDQVYLGFVEQDLSIWWTERISLDGIEDLKLSGNVVSGLAYNPTNGKAEWQPFRFDTNTRTLIEGEYLIF